VLAHVGWPTVGLAIVILIGRAIRDKDQTRRLIGLIVVLVAVVVGSVAICVELLGMQVPGFHVAAMTRATAPLATASPRPAPPVAADPVATASPSASGVSPMRADKERDPCSKADELLLHRLLARHGFDPDRRPHVCELAGVLVGGHELDSSETCACCSQGVPGSSRFGRGRDRGGIEPAGQAAYFNFAAVHVPRADRDRDRSRLLCPTGCAGRYCRTARSPAGRRHPRRGTRDRAPRLRTRGRPVPAPPARPPSRSPGSPAQPSAHPPSPAAPASGKSPGPPGRMYGNARSTQRLTSSRSPRPARPVRGRPWKADGAHRPS
jgi:hypothetical protein